MMSRLTAAVVLSAALLAAADAGAFVREKAEGSLKPLYWPGLPVPFAINAACAGPQEDTATCLSTVQASFDVWTQPPCTVLRFDYQGTTDRTDVGYLPGPAADNVNIVIWYLTGWPAEYGSQALALTTTTYDPSTGIIVDADLEVNGEDFPWRVLATEDTRYMDIGNTLTHEAGHFLGLDHVNDPGTTMYPTAPPGEVSKRALSSDDIDGVCTCYPVAGYDGGTESGGGAAIPNGSSGGSSAVTDDGSGSFGHSNGCSCTTIGIGF
jgi:hypothetical protein